MFACVYGVAGNLAHKKANIDSRCAVAQPGITVVQISHTTGIVSHETYFWPACTCCCYEVPEV